MACVRALLDANLKSLHSAEYRLRNPIHYAAFEGHVHLVKFLLDKGANPDQRWVIIFWRCLTLRFSADSSPLIKFEITKLILSLTFKINFIPGKGSLLLSYRLSCKCV